MIQFIRIATWGLIVFLFFKDVLNLWNFSAILFVGAVLVKAAKQNKFGYADHGLDPMAESDAKRRQEEIEKIAKRLQEEAAKMHRQQEEWIRYRPPPGHPTSLPDALALDRDTVTQIRNTLLRHHNSRGTDKDYQDSKMGKETVAILQKLNDMTQEKRRHD